MIKRKNYDRGFIQLIIVIVIALIILGSFGLSLRSVMTEPVVHDNLAFFKELVFGVWNMFLKTPVMFIWNEVIVKLLLNSLQGN